MEDNRFIKRLDKTEGSSNTNILLGNNDFATKVEFSHSNRPLVETDIDHVIHQGELYNTERQSCTKYRMLGTVMSLFHNTLHDKTSSAGQYAFDTFEDPMYRDRSHLGGEALTYKDSVNYYVKELNGWQGFVKPITPQTIFSQNTCDWIDLSPTRHEFEMINPYQENWKLILTYPFSSTTNHFLVKDPVTGLKGLKIIDAKVIPPNSVGGRTVISITTATKHGLKESDEVMIYALSPLDNGGQTSTGTPYSVYGVGLNSNDLNKDYVFLIEKSDIFPVNISLDHSRMKKMIHGVESEYYFRIFRRMNEDSDYEIYPLTFSNTTYNDSQYQFVFNGGSGDTIDMDISMFRDNLNRPLSEMFLTCIKTDPNGIFTPIKSGVEIPFSEAMQADLQFNPPFFAGCSDIHRIHDGGIVPRYSHDYIETGILPSWDYFWGDLVEYNQNSLYETVLGEVHHRFNTKNRILPTTIYTTTLLNTTTAVTGSFFAELWNEIKESSWFGAITSFLDIDDEFHETTKTVPVTVPDSTPLDMGVRQEGYYYKAHNRIMLRSWSDYIQKGYTAATIQWMGGNEYTAITRTVGIPDYATPVNGEFWWREQRDIGETELVYNDESIDYPYTNGSHYIHKTYLLSLKRQDPFGKYGLYYGLFPKDPYGDSFDDKNYIFKAPDNVC